jgi:hypothetical protein
MLPVVAGWWEARRSLKEPGGGGWGPQKGTAHPYLAVAGVAPGPQRPTHGRTRAEKTARAAPPRPQAQAS